MRLALAVLLIAAAPAAAQSDVLDFSEVTPEIVGGLAALQSSIVYPVADLAAERQGTVVLRFVVTTDGTAAAIAVARRVSAGLDSAAVRAVRAARFRPGRQDGQPVNVRITLPIRFSIAGVPAAAPAAPRRFDLGALTTSLGLPRMPTAIPPADSVRITQSPAWGEMVRFTWRTPAPGLDRIDAYSSADTLRFATVVFSPGATSALDSLQRRLADMRPRTQDDGFVLAYDLATSGLGGTADLQLDAGRRRLTYRQPVCRERQRPEACASPFPVLIGGLRALQESVVYPEGARRAGIGGQVDVAVDVQADGSIAAIRAVTADGRRPAADASLAEAALAAVSRAAFAPAVRAGVPVAATLVVPVRFAIVR